MRAPVLTTARLVLDSVTADDTDRVFEYCQDAQIRQFVPIPDPYTRASAEYFTGQYVADSQEGAFTFWAIRDAASREFLGTIELRNMLAAGASVGYWLGAEHRGSGIMTEALAAVLEFAFGEGGRQRVEWEAVTGNVGSAISAQRAGLRFEGTRRLGGVFHDRRVDAWYAGILRDDDRTPQPGWPHDSTGSVTSHYVEGSRE